MKKVAVRAGLGRSMLARLMRHTHRGADEDASSSARQWPGFPRAQLLQEQYRMAPAISAFANRRWYGGRLVDATTGAARVSADAHYAETARRALSPASHNASGSFLFVDVASGCERGGAGASCSNQREVPPRQRLNSQVLICRILRV